MRCNAGTSPVGKKCPVKAGDTITVEMHEVSTLKKQTLSQLRVLTTLSAIWRA